MDKAAAIQYAEDTVHCRRDAFISLLAAETLHFLYMCHVQLVSRCKSLFYCQSTNTNRSPSFRTAAHVICMISDPSDHWCVFSAAA